MKLRCDYDDQGFILLGGLPSLIRKLNMPCMLVYGLIKKNVIYRVDVRQFIVAGIPC